MLQIILARDHQVWRLCWESISNARAPRAACALCWLRVQPRKVPAACAKALYADAQLELVNGETAKARETPKHFCFDQCGQQGCNFCESSIWASWNLPALLAVQSRLVTSMWAGMRLKELTSSPAQLEKLANSLRQIPDVCGHLPSPPGKSSELLPLAALRCWTDRELRCRGYAPPGAGEGMAVLGSKVMSLAL